MPRPGVRYFYLRARGRENVLAKYPVAHPAFPAPTGGEEVPGGGESVATSVSFGSLLSVGAGQRWGGKYGHLKCRLARAREREDREGERVSSAVRERRRKRKSVGWLVFY